MSLLSKNFCVVLFFFAFFACGEGDEAQKKNSDEGAKGNESSEAADNDAGQDEEVGADGLKKTWCGDATKQKIEECDDGNNNDDDGCTSLCTLSCQTDQDCDDGDPCNGPETCQTKNHICQSGSAADNGVSCGTGKSCRSGLCRRNACGDGLTYGDEACDDANLDDADGCNRRCQYTCVSDDDRRNCPATDACAAQQTCNDKHMCEVIGSAAPDKTDCQYTAGAQGWCMQGSCVPVACGDGQVSASEECDSGKDKDGNNVQCSPACQKVVCGNGRIDGAEQCDDGNTANLDGCDSHCKPEIVYRLTRMDLVRGTPPAECVYHDEDDAGKGNAFVNAIAEKINIGGLTLNVNDLINSFMSNNIAAGSTNAMFQALDLDVLTANMPDDNIRIGIYAGSPAKDLGGSTPGIDFPFYVEPMFVTDGNQPAYVIQASLKAGGLIVTTAPADVTVTTPIGLFTMSNLISRSTLNLESASRIAAPPAVIEDVQVPRTMGDDPNTQSIICGAISTHSLEQIGLYTSAGGGSAGGISLSMLLGMCCWDPAVRQEPYRSCAENDKPFGPDKNCDSFLDLMQGGCDAYVNGCGNGGEHHPLIYPTQPDVDSDNDGVKDGYSGVIAIQGTRARIVGVKAAQQPGIAPTE
jgi:cysteine-rich repeat protein